MYKPKLNDNGIEYSDGAGRRYYRPYPLRMEGTTPVIIEHREGARCLVHLGPGEFELEWEPEGWSMPDEE